MTPSGSYPERPPRPPRARDPADPAGPADPALELLREQHAELRALTQRHGEQIATLLVDGPRGTPREGARGPAAGPAPGEGTAFGGTFGAPRSGARIRGPPPKGPLRRRVKGTAAVAVAADSEPRHRKGECARLEDPRAKTRHPDDDNGGGGGEDDRGDGRGEEDPEQRGDVALILGLLGSSRARGPPPERNPTRPPSSPCRGARGRGGARPPRAPVDCDLRRSENEAVRAWLRGAAARARVARGALRREARRRREEALRESRERERRGEQSAGAVRAWMEAKRREGGRGRGGAAEGGSAPGGQRGESEVEPLKEKRKALTQIKHGDTGTLRERGATGTERERAQAVGSPTKKGVTGIEREKGGPMFLRKRGGTGTQREQCAGSPKEKEGKGTVGRKGGLGAPVESRAPGKRGEGPRIRTGATGTEREQRSEPKRDTRRAALLVRKEGAWPQRQQRVEALEGKGSAVTPSEKGGTEQGARPQMEQGGTESVKRSVDTGICREQGEEPVQVKGSAVTPSEKGDARPTGGERGAEGDAEGEGRERKGGRVSLPATTPSQGLPVKGFRRASGGREGPRTPSTHEAELVSSLARRRKGALRGWGSRVGRAQEAQGTEGIAEPALGPEGNGVEPQQIPAWLKGARLPPTALSRLMEKLRVGDDGERKGVQRGALEPLGVRPDPQGCAAPQNLGL